MGFDREKIKGKLLRFIQKSKHEAVFFIFLSGTYPVYAARHFLISLHSMIIKRDLGILVLINQLSCFNSRFPWWIVIPGLPQTQMLHFNFNNIDILNKGDNYHAPLALRAQQRIYMIVC